MVSQKSYHNNWEFWVYNAIYGVFQAPYFAFSQTVMADLCPSGFDFMVRATLITGYSNASQADAGWVGGNRSSSVCSD